MDSFKEDVKKWLTSIGKDRKWLSEALGFALSKEEGIPIRTIDRWLMQSSKKVPAWAEMEIRKLMSENTATKELRTLPNPDSRGRIPFELDVETLERAEKEALRLGMTLSAYCSLAVEWCSERPDISEEIAELLEEEKKHPVKLVLPPSFAPIQSPKELYFVTVIGNIAAGALAEGDTEPYSVKTNTPLGKNEYVLRVSGKSMEPQIIDGSLVVMSKHTVPPIPKVGTIVEYQDERGVTIKKLAQRKTAEGKEEYILHSINPAFPDILPMDGGKISAIYLRTLPSLHHSA